MALERFRVAELTWPEYDALIRATPVIVRSVPLSSTVTICRLAAMRCT